MDDIPECAKDIIIEPVITIIPKCFSCQASVRVTPYSHNKAGADTEFRKQEGGGGGGSG